MFRKTHHTLPKIILWLSTLITLLNSFTLEIPILGFFALLGVLFGLSKLIGPSILNKQSSVVQTGAGFIISVALFSIFGSAIYYAMPVTQFSLSVALIVIVIIASVIGKKSETKKQKSFQFVNIPPIVTTGIITSILSLSAWFYVASQVSITDSVRTLWDYVNPFSIVEIGISIIIIFGLLKKERAQNIVLLLTGTTFFASIALASIIYPHGFGFDPFIHRATIAHIAEFGTITPKPLYYIGEYALELFATKTFSLPLDLVDKFLVPILASLLITLSGVIGFSLTFKEDKLVPLIAIFFIPFGALITTTPQSLAYIFTASLVLLSLPRLIGKEYMMPRYVLGIMTLAVLVTHPIAGIPALIYFLLVLIATSESGYPAVRNTGLIIVAILGSVSLPLIFALQAKMSGLNIQISLDKIFDFSLLNLNWFFENRFSSVLDLMYLIIDNYLWLTLAISIIGLVYCIKNKSKNALFLPPAMTVICLINFWLLSSALQFEFLIEYERQNYADRLIVLAMIFALPMIAVAISGIHSRLSSMPRGINASFAILISLIVIANVYGAYPRHDNYARSAGFNVSDSDFDAVYAIEDDAEDDDFIVLANQAVSAAALESFGFKKYFNGDIFYYPIPTGGVMYEKYLEMTNKEPSKETAISAMSIVGVQTLYFVVNDYWWESEKIIEHAKLESDDWFSIGDGKITVFKYFR